MSTPICPKCHRELNLGNSPNLEECHGGDFDDDQQCELSAKIYELEQSVKLLVWAESLDGGISLEKNEGYPSNQLWTAYTMPQFVHGYGHTIIEAIANLQTEKYQYERSRAN